MQFENRLQGCGRDGGGRRVAMCDAAEARMLGLAGCPPSTLGRHISFSSKVYRRTLLAYNIPPRIQLPQRTPMSLTNIAIHIRPKQQGRPEVEEK